MNDIMTMIWKESRDTFLQGGRAGLIRPLILIGVMGIALPLRFGSGWLELSPNVMLVVVYIPFINIIGFVGDSIAGERERHTLETLLASRINDRAILLGKLIVTVGYSWGMALVGLLLGSLSVNLFIQHGSWTFYHPFDLFLEVLAVSLLFSILAGSAGVLISLHSTTVRQAQQTLILGTLGLGFVTFFVLRTVPADIIASLSYPELLLLIMGVCVVLDLILFGAALISFQRSRLMLR